MFGLGKKKKFEHHQKLLFQCQRFAEFVMAVAQENADADQIEFWETKLGRIAKVRDASLRKQGIIDKNDEFFWKRLRKKAKRLSTKPICPNNNLSMTAFSQMMDGKTIYNL